MCFVSFLRKYLHFHSKRFSGDAENARHRSDKEQQYQYKYHGKKTVVEVIDSPEDYEILDAEKYKSDKYKTIEDPELIKRRAKLLEADREMNKRKELAREELEARRELLREKEFETRSPRSHKRSSHHRSHKKKHSSPHEVIHLSDASDSNDGNETTKR